MNILIVNQSDVGDRTIFVYSKEDIHHLVKVLRSKVGDVVPVSDGSCWEYLGRIDEISPEGITLSIVDKQRHGRELSYEVTLFQGVPKSPKLELIVRKAVELGASGIVPVFMDRCVTRATGKEGKKVQRLQKIADEAVKQCLSPRKPKVDSYMEFKEMAHELEHYDLVLFPYENEEGKTIRDILRKWKNDVYESYPDIPDTVDISRCDGAKNCQDVSINIDESGNDGLSNLRINSQSNPHVPQIAIVIGPEGGFSTREVDILERMGIVPVSLGKSILRTETAGHAVLSMLLYEMEL